MTFSDVLLGEIVREEGDFVQVGFFSYTSYMATTLTHFMYLNVSEIIMFESC